MEPICFNSTFSLLFNYSVSLCHLCQLHDLYIAHHSSPWRFTKGVGGGVFMTLKLNDWYPDVV